MGDLLPDNQRRLLHHIFATSAGMTIFFFAFYFALTVGIPVDLDFIYPGAQSYPWWLTPVTLAWSVFCYQTINRNTLTFGERQ